MYVTADGQHIAQCPTCGSHPRHRAFALLFGEWLTLARPTSRLLHVAPDDIGKVIGRGGRIARALRTVVRASAVRDGRRVLVEIAG